ncbi:MAG: type I DNA topoisomerase, partial [Candidatus Omnitrophica bacterium]|nr:type I DNA topoisomerase [Candidatus Omnitrophota bacterium]
MAKKLVIVESPAKAKTIHKILGRDFAVTSSMGHLVDLPASKLGVDVEHDFEPHYIVIHNRRKLAKQLLHEARGKTAVYLAPDPDREGEAISWHLARLLRKDDDGRKIYRITFHEITTHAVKSAVQHPAEIDQDKVD